MKKLLLLLIISCNPQPVSPECSDKAYQTQLIDCASRAAACVQNDGSESECGKICDKEWAAWQEHCQ